MDMDQFQERILNHMLLTFEDSKVYKYSDLDKQEITKRRDSKFSTWEWNFGYSPRYQFNKRIPFTAGHLELHMNVEKGVIRELKIQGGFNSQKDIGLLEQKLIGCIHDPETIRIRLSDLELSEYIYGLENEELLAGMF
jgi:lipoate-protein ligase A